jgi:ribosome-associated protein
MRSLPIRDAAQGLPLQAAVQIAGWAETGGQAKILVQQGQVTVNGQVETRRSHFVRLGDVLSCSGEEVEITSDDR